MVQSDGMERNTEPVERCDFTWSALWIVCRGGCVWALQEWLSVCVMNQVSTPTGGVKWTWLLCLLKVLCVISGVRLEVRKYRRGRAPLFEKTLRYQTNPTFHWYCSNHHLPTGWPIEFMKDYHRKKMCCFSNHMMSTNHSPISSVLVATISL